MSDRKHESFAEVIESCHALLPLRTAVVYPCEKISLSGAAEAAAADIIKPTLDRLGPGAGAELQR
jgi:phosphate acetyltransferase